MSDAKYNSRAAQVRKDLVCCAMASALSAGPSTVEELTWTLMERDPRLFEGFAQPAGMVSRLARRPQFVKQGDRVSIAP